MTTLQKRLIDLRRRLDDANRRIETLNRNGVHDADLETLTLLGEIVFDMAMNEVWLVCCCCGHAIEHRNSYIRGTDALCPNCVTENTAGWHCVKQENGDVIICRGRCIGHCFYETFTPVRAAR